MGKLHNNYEIWCCTPLESTCYLGVSCLNYANKSKLYIQQLLYNDEDYVLKQKKQSSSNTLRNYNYFSAFYLFETQY